MRALRYSLLIGLLVATVGSEACSGNRSTIEIRARSAVSEVAGIAGIRLQFNSVQYTCEDFTLGSAGFLRIFAEVPNSGTLLIEMELIQDATVVSEGSFTLAMSDDFEWGIDLFRQAGDPQEFCFGCLGSEGFPIAEMAQNEPGEAIWLSWGGRPRGSDIVF